MNKVKELYERFFHEDTPEFQTWLRNRLLWLSGASGSVLILVDRFPNDFSPWVAKAAGWLVIGGVFGAGSAQTAKKDLPIPMEKPEGKDEA